MWTPEEGGIDQAQTDDSTALILRITAVSSLAQETGQHEFWGHPAGSRRPSGLAGEHLNPEPCATADRALSSLPWQAGALEGNPVFSWVRRHP